MTATLHRLPRTPMPPDEPGRLQALYDLALLDTGAEAKFDRLARLAAQLVDAPIGLITLVDRDRVWVKASYGLGCDSVARAGAVCAYNILDDGSLVVEDLREDHRFAGHPLVAGASGLRLYAGAPLITETGHRLGSICALDYAPGRIDPDQRQGLEALAATAMEMIEPAAPGEPVAPQPAATTASRRRALERELQREDYDQQFHLVYQPIVDLEAARPVAYEALLRWDHPTLGRISPAEFIPLAEALGAIVPLGRWVTDQACARLARRRRSETGPGPSPRMAVNVSPRQLSAPGFIDELAAILGRHAVPADRLMLEVTESTVVDARTDILPRLHQLHRLGVGLAMDDFGTGYSSLSGLHSYPINAVKLDRSFVIDAPAQPQLKAVLQTITSLARTLELQVIAEGVEREQHMTMLRELGCDYAQGFFFGKPAA